MHLLFRASITAIVETVYSLALLCGGEYIKGVEHYPIVFFAQKTYMCNFMLKAIKVIAKILVGTNLRSTIRIHTQIAVE